MALANAKQAAIDFDHLNQYTGGDVPLTREVLQLFRVQCAQLLETLKTSDDAKTVRETAHGIKGACRSVGAWEAAHAAESVEQALTKPADLVHAIAALAEILPRVWAAALAFEQGSPGKA